MPQVIRILRIHYYYYFYNNRSYSFLGYIAEKFGKIECFFFSAVCTAIAFVFTLAVSLHTSFKAPTNNKYFKAEQQLKKEGENKEVDEKLIKK